MKAYVFPGQGAQFPGMGKDLYENNGYDITQFIKNQCKLDTTKIEVIIEQREPLVIKYNPVLDCKKVQKK